MFVKTKGMTIEEIVGVEMDYPAVLCKFADGLCDVCYVDYDCNKDGSDVVMKGYPVGHRYVAEHHGAVVEAYEVIFDGTANTLRKWHGQYTDDQEPRKGEMCIILLETSCGNRKRYEIRQAVYREEGFCGYKESTESKVMEHYFSVLLSYRRYGAMWQHREHWIPSNHTLCGERITA